MKLIIAIVQNEILNKLVKSLMASNYRTTKLSSTGGFLKSGNTTLLIGVEDEKLDEVIGIIEEECKGEQIVKDKGEIAIGNVNLFVLNMEDFIRM